jgi:prepilin-type N-terminal cleavage/methylation domain-containing protein
MRRGYTLIEVLIVVTIIGIASGIVVPHMMRSGSIGVQAAARMIIGDILVAQNDAIAKQSPRQVIFEPVENRYRIVDGAGNPVEASWRGGSSTGGYAVDLDDDGRFDGARIVSADFGGGSSTLAFDAMGGPASGGEVIIEFEAQRFRVAVAQFTGRVTVERLN